MISVVLAGIYFSISFYEWITLILTFNLVIVSEMLNTAIEAMVDLITLERRQDAKVAKDVSAGMVLVSAIFSIAIGLFIFVPKILITLNQ
jgi:diacylglycerol kinase